MNSSAKNFLIFLRYLFILLSICYCSENKNRNIDFKDYVSKDKSKLAAEIVDKKLRIKFNPPLNWLLKSSELSKKIESRTKIANPQEKNFIYQPVYLFFNDSTKSLLSVGFVDYPDSSMDINTKLNYYKNILSNKFQANQSDNFEIRNFTYSDIDFTQFKYETEKFVNYKIVFSNLKNSIIVFDCTIQKNKIEEESELLKASIGSIKLIR